jgi:hypothetical protein
MSALSSALIAIGFAATKPELLTPMLWTTLPTIFVLGVFTVVRLVDTGVQNIDELARIARIRTYYLSLSEQVAPFFGDSANSSDTGRALGSMSLHPGTRLGLFTIASMIAVVDSVVGGAGVALALRAAAHSVPTSVAMLVGVAAFAGCYALFFRNQDQRYKTESKTHSPRPA